MTSSVVDEVIDWPSSLTTLSSVWTRISIHGNHSSVTVNMPPHLYLEIATEGFFRERLTPQLHICRMHCHILVLVSRVDGKLQLLEAPFQAPDSERSSFGCVYGSGSPDWLLRKKPSCVFMAPVTDVASSFAVLLSVVVRSRMSVPVHCESVCSLESCLDL